jgi:hypothetical protein
MVSMTLYHTSFQPLTAILRYAHLDNEQILSERGARTAAVLSAL